MAKIRLSRKAKADLDEIWLYIAQDNIVTADRFVELLVSKFPMLADYPDAGRKRPRVRRW